jgi:hypothetical protein
MNNHGWPEFETEDPAAVQLWPRPFVVAYHGDFASGKILKRDSCGPWWVDWWPNWKRNRRAQELPTDRPVALLAFSGGGDLTARQVGIYPNVVAVVNYECPNRRDIVPRGKCPVLAAWNRNGRGIAGGSPEDRIYWTAEAKTTMEQWAAGHPLQLAFGNGGHVRRARGWPPLGHDWDTELNPTFFAFIQQAYAAELEAGRFQSRPSDLHKWRPWGAVGNAL